MASFGPRARVLHEICISDPFRAGGYGFTPARERRIRYLQTPAGTLVREVTYHQVAGSQVLGCWPFKQTARWGAEVWSEAGHLLATSHQVAYFKE